jgi:hypothetical protein
MNYFISLLLLSLLHILHRRWDSCVLIKGKKLSLCFNWTPRHEGLLGEWRYSSTHSMTSALEGGEWSASRPSRFIPRGRAPGTHWIGGWVGPRAVLDAVMKRKIPAPRRESNPTTPIVQPVAQRYTDWAITALFAKFHRLRKTSVFCVVLCNRTWDKICFIFVRHWRNGTLVEER